MAPADPQRILVIRRDNIGDLVCTMPLIAAVRVRYPQAHLAALTNSYNLAVLSRNPDLDAVYAYTKLKHRPATQGIAAWLWKDRLQLLFRLARARFDLVVLASPQFQPAAARFARFARARHVLGVTPDGAPRSGIDLVPAIPATAKHEVERVFGVLSGLGIGGDPPPLRLVADTELCDEARVRLAALGAARVVAVHISARKPSQRWPAERFIALMRSLHAAESCAFALFWSPGASDNPLHPGDDDKARRILDELGKIPRVPVLPMRTDNLEQLIAGISACSAVICSDGGAMHIAAALGKPILCLFGDSDRVRWHPWGVRFELLQAESRSVEDISVDDAIRSWRLLAASPTAA